MDVKKIKNKLSTYDKDITSKESEIERLKNEIKIIKKDRDKTAAYLKDIESMNERYADVIEKIASSTRGRKRNDSVSDSNDNNSNSDSDILDGILSENISQ